MPSSLPLQKQTETEIVILQVHYDNLSEKIDDIKVGMKEMRETNEKYTNETQSLIREFQTASAKSHRELSAKVNVIERWRWSLMGAGVVIGVVALPIVEKLLGIAS